MALEWTAGFDAQTIDDLYLDWDSISNPRTSVIGVGTTAGRFGGQALSIANGSLVKTLTPVTTRIVGLAFFLNGSYGAGGPIVSFYDDSTGTSQMDVRITSNGHLFVTRNSTTLGTSTFKLNVSAWYYMEISVTIGSVSGAYEVRIGQTTVLSASGVNTQASVNNTTDLIVIAGADQRGGGGSLTYLDDIYVLNTAGPKDNTFLGERKIITSLPSSDVSVQWSKSSGTTNFGNVDDPTQNGDVDYNYTNIVGQQDLLGIQPLTSFTGNAVTGIRLVITARKDDANVRRVCSVLNSGVTVVDSGDKNLLSSWQVFSDIFDSDPNTGVDWLAADVNALKIGYKMTL